MKPNLLAQLPTFHGTKDENPYRHVSDFKVVCQTMPRDGLPLRWYDSLFSPHLESYSKKLVEFVKVMEHS